MKQLSVFLILFSIFSCEKDDPNDAVIQAKVERIVGTWEVTNLKVAKTIPDSLKAVLASFRFYFPKCDNYKANKSSYPTSTGCRGQIEVDKSIFSLYYDWDISKEEYSLALSPVDGNVPVEGNKRAKTNALLAGIYTLDIKDNDIVFTQMTKNPYIGNAFYGVSFTAKRVQ